MRLERVFFNQPDWRMRNWFVLLVVLVAGCGGGEFQISPVSGTVTFDDEPLAGVEVIFAPMEDDDKINVGPASRGTTDADGRYTLTTLKGLNGAVVTKHRVSIDLKEISGAEVMRRLDAEYAKKPGMSEREYMANERRIRQSMKKALGPQQSIPESYNKKTRLTFVVKGAIEDANFELKSDGN